jgi:hypothetical protein
LVLPEDEIINDNDTSEAHDDEYKDENVPSGGNNDDPARPKVKILTDDVLSMITDDNHWGMMSQNQMLHHLLFEQQAERVEEHASMQTKLNSTAVDLPNETRTPNRLLNRNRQKSWRNRNSAISRQQR